MERETLQSVIRFLIRILTRTHFVGAENIPTSGPVILATNHLSRIDLPVLFINPARPDLTALVTTKYQNYPFLRWIITTARGIWLNRDTADFTAFRVAAEVLKQDRALGIAPEGTRSQTGGLLEGKPGTILLALRSGAPIVPVGLMGTAGSVPKIFTLRRPRIVAHFGEPFNVPPLERENRDQQLAALTEELMCRIAVLMPEEYHGFYRGNPRLQQMIEARGGPFDPNTLKRVQRPSASRRIITQP